MYACGAKAVLYNAAMELISVYTTKELKNLKRGLLSCENLLEDLKFALNFGTTVHAPGNVPLCKT